MLSTRKHLIKPEPDEAIKFSTLPQASERSQTEMIDLTLSSDDDEHVDPSNVSKKYSLPPLDCMTNTAPRLQSIQKLPNTEHLVKLPRSSSALSPLNTPELPEPDLWQRLSNGADLYASDARKRNAYLDPDDHRPAKLKKQDQGQSGVAGVEPTSAVKQVETDSCRLITIRFGRLLKDFSDLIKERTPQWPKANVKRVYGRGPSFPEKYLSWYIPREADEQIHKLQSLPNQTLNKIDARRIVHVAPNRNLWYKDDGRESKFVLQRTGEVLEVNFFALPHSTHALFRGHWVIVAQGPRTKGAILHYERKAPGREPAYVSYRIFGMDNEGDESSVRRYLYEPTPRSLTIEYPGLRTSESSTHQTGGDQGRVLRAGLKSQNTSSSSSKKSNHQSPNLMNRMSLRSSALSPTSHKKPQYQYQHSAAKGHPEEQESLATSSTATSPQIQPVVYPIGYSPLTGISPFPNKISSAVDHQSPLPHPRRISGNARDSVSSAIPSAAIDSQSDVTPPHQYSARDHAQFPTYILSHTSFIFPRREDQAVHIPYTQCAGLVNLSRQALGWRLIDKNAYLSKDCLFQLEIDGSDIEYVPGDSEEKFEDVKRAIESSTRWSLDGSGGLCGSVDVIVSVL